MKTTVPVLALFAALFALAAPATAAASPVQTTTPSGTSAVAADLNGDGTLDRVTARPAPGATDSQILTAFVGGGRYTVVIPMDGFFGVQPLRVGDVDGDGRHEIFATEVVGANTLWFTVWHLVGDRWQPLRGAAGNEEVVLYEGGGVSAISGYGCENVSGRRELYTVGAELDWGTGLYAGEKVNYVVRDGVATEVSRQAITGPREAFPADHAACA